MSKPWISLTKLDWCPSPNFKASSKPGIGGTGGTGWSHSTGGGPSGTLVPFGVYFAGSRLPHSGLTAASRILALGVRLPCLLPCLACRSLTTELPTPFDFSLDIPPTADHGEVSPPTLARPVDFSSLPLSSSTCCNSIEFWSLKKLTSSASNIFWRSSDFEPEPWSGSLTCPTGPIERFPATVSPGISPSVLAGVLVTTVGRSRAMLGTPAEMPPRPFPVRSVNEGGTAKPDATLWMGSLLSLVSKTFGKSPGLEAASRNSSWVFCDQKGFTPTSPRPRLGTDWDLAIGKTQTSKNVFWAHNPQQGSANRWVFSNKKPQHVRWIDPCDGYIYIYIYIMCV